MRMLAPVLFLLCAAPSVLAQDSTSTAVESLFPANGMAGRWADTVRVDHLLDSAKAWVATGETERSYRAARLAAEAINAINDGGDKRLLDQRALQAAKLEGVAHHYAGRYAEALAAFTTMERVAERMGNDKLRAAAMNYQAYQYRATDDITRAKSLTLQALAILDKLPEDGNLANTYSGLGTILFDEADRDSALLIQRKTLGIYERMELLNHAALCRMDIAEIHMKEERFDSALHYLQMAAPVLQNDENLGQRCIYLGQLARALCGVGKYQEARSILLEAERIALELENNEYRSRTYELLALVASATGESAQALSYLDKARTAHTNDLDIEKTQAITEVRMKAEQEREAERVAAELAEEKRKKRNALFGGGLLLVIAVLGFGLYRNSARNALAMRAKNEELVRAQEQLIISEKEREASEVRTRIARDVHDQLGSDLTKLAMLSSEVGVVLKNDPVALARTAQDIERVAAEANRSLGDIVWAIDPHHDSLAGLTERVRAHAERMLEWSHVKYTIDCVHEGPDVTLDPGTKRDVYLILREGLNNAIKYAKAEHIGVVMRTDQRSIHLVVEDDGKGMGDKEQANGHGLANMRARAERIGARFSMDGTKGTRLQLDLAFTT